MQIASISEVRKEFKKLGFKLKTKRYSDFIGTEIIHIESGKKFNSILFSQEEVELFRPARELKQKYKNRVYEGEFKVVL